VLILDNNDCNEPVWDWKNCSKFVEDVTVSQTNITFSANVNEEDNSNRIILSSDHHHEPPIDHLL